MKIVSDHKKIKWNQRIGQWTSLASLAVLIAGLVLSFQGQYINWSFAALLVGLVLSQVGIFFGNRWGRSPRIDERISAGLKGMNDQYALYHYTTKVSHLVVGPSGVWTLIPYYQPGKISYEKNKFQQRGIGFFSRVFAQETLGRPDLEATASVDDTRRYLKSVLGTNEIPEVHCALVFTSEKATVDAAGSPIPIMTADKLKDFMRRMAKEAPLAPEQYKRIQDALPQED